MASRILALYVEAMVADKNILVRHFARYWMASGPLPQEVGTVLLGLDQEPGVIYAGMDYYLSYSTSLERHT